MIAMIVELIRQFIMAAPVANRKPHIDYMLTIISCVFFDIFKFLNILNVNKDC